MAINALAAFSTGGAVKGLVARTHFSGSGGGNNGSGPRNAGPVIREDAASAATNLHKITIVNRFGGHIVLSHKTIDAVHRSVVIGITPLCIGVGLHGKVEFTILIGDIGGSGTDYCKAAVGSSNGGKGFENSGFTMETVTPCESSLGVAAPADGHHHFIFAFTDPILNVFGSDGSIHNGIRVLRIVDVVNRKIAVPPFGQFEIVTVREFIGNAAGESAIDVVHQHATLDHYIIFAITVGDVLYP